MTKTMSAKIEAIATYARETYETTSPEQTIIFKLNSIQVIAPDTFVINLKCSDIQGFDKGYHAITQYFTFGRAGTKYFAYPCYNYTKENDIVWYNQI